MIIGHVPVVHGRDVRDAVNPERLRMAEVDPAFGRQPRVSDGHRTGPGRNAVSRLELSGGAHLLHQVEPSTHAKDLQPATTSA